MEKDIGKRMQQYRVANKLSLDELSEKVHVPKADLMRMELGQKSPSNFLLHNLCQLYGIADFSKPPTAEDSLFSSEEE